MTLSFPPSPTSGQTYQNWQWDGAKWVPYAAPSVIVTSGNRVLLSKQTVTTPVASVAFTSLFSNAYDIYELDIVDVTVSAAGVFLQARVSADGGATWITTSTYSYGGFYTSGTTGNYVGSASASAAALVEGDVPNVAGTACSIKLRMFQPWRTDLYKAWMTDTITIVTAAGGLSRAMLGGQMGGGLAAYNSLQISAGSGNINSGVLNLYGVKP